LDASSDSCQKQGCALYVRNNFPAHKLYTFSTDGLQIIAGAIEFTGYQNVVVLALYRDPSYPLSSFLTHLADVLSRCKAANMILMGDFNVDLLAETVFRKNFKVSF
jgi:hypothetical protein